MSRFAAHQANSLLVIPAKAGIQRLFYLRNYRPN